MTGARIPICLLAVCTALSLCSPAFALEKASKRNCAICHVMWLDDFRTDKETLIKWQPGNVLMKDTQGVVSSEEMCYSCHDGYVVDSRYIAWKYNQHKTFVKPPKNLVIPAGFPLSNKDEIYCGTCHSAHGGGANTNASISGPLSFLRKDNIDSQMCEMCHTQQAAFKRYYGHPVKTKSYDIPEILFAAGSKLSKGGDKVICQTCHEVHGAKGDKLTVINNKDSMLCTVCHTKQKSLFQTKHDFRVSLPDQENIRGQKPAASGPCAACHLPHKGYGILLWAREIDPTAPPSQLCLGCHGQDSLLKIKHVGNYSHPVDVALSPTESAAGILPLFLGNGNNDPSGKVQCFTCHNVHRWDPNNVLNIGGKDVQGDASTSFLRVSTSGSSTLCTDCHQDKKQLLTSDHNLEITAPKEKNLQDRTARASGPCGACHIPHNASGKRLWAKPLPAEKDFISELCAGCHSKTGAAKERRVGENSHPIDVPLLQTKMVAILEKVSEKLPLYSKDGDKTADGTIACDTCHEPHHWTSSKSGPLEDYKGQNMEGTGANSFLRKVNYPSPELCKVCHPAKGRIEGTQHDLRERSSEAEGQTAKPSGLCEACHLVHNALNPLKLWARPYGPTKPWTTPYASTSENGSPMNRLCTSCHAKGEMAAKKVPSVAFHPPGKLITNVMRYNREGTKYTPIFGADGKEKNVGNLSCPSCHNAHQWGPPAEKATPGKEPSAASTKSFRFLKTMSYNAVCRECHGPEGIFRYLYFHVQGKRSKKF